MSHGFSLMEMMIGMLLSTILMSGVIRLLSESVSTYRTQLSQSNLEASSRYAHDVLTSHISQAGFQPYPWKSEPNLPALTDETLNRLSPLGDQLGLQRWSMRNCYGNENPVTNGDGQPKFHLLQTRFRVNASNNLAMTCRYGPDASRLKVQINNYGLVEDVAAMQVLYAEDRNGDNIADNWVNAQSWQQESNILAAKIGLLLSTRQAIDQPAKTQFTLLDETITKPADGHIRKTSTFTVAIRGRLK